MKLLKASLLLLTVLFSLSGMAQTVDDIIAKHIEAIGGKEKLATITSVKMENTMTIMGNEAPSTAIILNGKGYRSESEYNGQKIIQVVTDKGGWALNPMTGNTEPQAMPEEQLKAAKDQLFIVPFLDYAARGKKAELVGQEKVGDVNAYKVKLSGADNTSTTYYFDPKTYYLIQAVRSQEMMGQQMDVTTSYSDYQKSDYGWVVPHAMNVSFGGQFSMDMKLKSVEVNKPVDTAIFEMKKS
jgi:hypothetical protein